MKPNGSYHRVWSSIWDEFKGDPLHMAFYLLTGPHRRTEGIYRLPLAYAAHDTGWALPKVKRNLGVLVDAEFLEHDPGADLVLIVKALKRQPPENPNQIKAVVKQVGGLPDSPLVPRFFELAQRFCQPLAKGLAEGLPERFPKPFGNGSPNPSGTVRRGVAQTVPQTLSKPH